MLPGNALAFGPNLGKPGWRPFSSSDREGRESPPAKKKRCSDGRPTARWAGFGRLVRTCSRVVWVAEVSELRSGRGKRVKSRGCLESSRLCESTLGDETALEAESPGTRLAGETWFAEEPEAPRASTAKSRASELRRRYSLMEGVSGERRAALLTEAAGSTPSTSHSPSGAFRAGGSVTGNLRGYVFSSSHGRQRRGGARRKASHLGGRKRPGSA